MHDVTMKISTSFFFSDCRFVLESSFVLDIGNKFSIFYRTHRSITMHNKPCTKYVLLISNFQNYHHVFATPDVVLGLEPWGWTRLTLLRRHFMQKVL